MMSETFFKSVLKLGVDDCWIWQGRKHQEGYGRYSEDGKEWLAHRYSATLVYGEIPSGNYVCHTCDTPSCVNPNHLFLGSPQDNVDDMMSKNRDYWSGRTHCKNGHEYTDENTHYKPSRPTHRVCKRCVTISSIARDRSIKTVKRELYEKVVLEKEYWKQKYYGSFGE